MIHAILHQVHDPLVAALPVFAVFIAIEVVAYMFESNEPSAGRGYSAIDSRTSTAMGLGALTVSPAFRAASLVAYTALYVYVAPWHAPAGRWPTGAAPSDVRPDQNRSAPITSSACNSTNTQPSSATSGKRAAGPAGWDTSSALRAGSQRQPIPVTG